jgi:hypothetical protein
MTRRSIARDPVRLGWTTFTATLIIQFCHEAEHVAQMLQKYHWHYSVYQGILGLWFDFEWIHFLYNLALWIALLATWLIHHKNPGIWRASGLGAAILMFLLVFQGYHVLEHSIRMVQYYQGLPKPPGLLGQVIPVLELHFWLGMVVSSAMLLAYGCFDVWNTVRVRLGWTRPRRSARPAQPNPVREARDVA